MLAAVSKSGAVNTGAFSTSVVVSLVGLNPERDCMESTKFKLLPACGVMTVGIDDSLAVSELNVGASAITSVIWEGVGEAVCQLFWETPIRPDKSLGGGITPTLDAVSSLYRFGIGSRADSLGFIQGVFAGLFWIAISGSIRDLSPSDDAIWVWSDECSGDWLMKLPNANAAARQTAAIATCWIEPMLKLSTNQRFRLQFTRQCVRDERQSMASRSNWTVHKPASPAGGHAINYCTDLRTDTKKVPIWVVI